MNIYWPQMSVSNNNLFIYQKLMFFIAIMFHFIKKQTYRLFLLNLFNQYIPNLMQVCKDAPQNTDYLIYSLSD